MAKCVGILSCLLLIAPLAHAQIFKCVAKDGTDLYQNFPCGIDSIGSMATPGPTASTPTAPTQNAATAPIDLKPTKPNPNASPAISVATVKPATLPTEPRVGMTTEEVRALWGEPTEALWEEPGVGPRSELWSYGNSRSVRFIKNRVSAIEK